MAKTAEVESGTGVFASIITGLVTRVQARGGDVGADFHRLSKPEGGSLLDQIADLIVRAGQVAKNLFLISIGGNRTTEQVVAAGNYQYANSWINSNNFPWRRRQGKRTIELVDMAQHGFKSTYSLDDAMAVLQKLGLDRPVYEDGLLFGEQHPEKQRERSIMFPHVPVLDASGHSVVIYLWSLAGNRELNLFWTDYRWLSDTLVAGVRKS